MICEIFDRCHYNVYKAVNRDFHFMAKKKATRVLISDKGLERHFLDDRLHRENDLPAVIYGNGTKHWFRYGKFYRDNDLPAVIEWSGSKYWYDQDDNIHRDNGLPAIIFSNGCCLCYNHGEAKHFCPPLSPSGQCILCREESKRLDFCSTGLALLSLGALFLITR